MWPLAVISWGREKRLWNPRVRRSRGSPHSHYLSAKSCNCEQAIIRLTISIPHFTHSRARVGIQHPTPLWSFKEGFCADVPLQPSLVTHMMHFPDHFLWTLCSTLRTIYWYWGTVQCGDSLFMDGHVWRWIFLCWLSQEIWYVIKQEIFYVIKFQFSINAVIKVL
jgi:hypothetical protein